MNPTNTKKSPSGTFPKRPKVADGAAGGVGKHKNVADGAAGAIDKGGFVGAGPAPPERCDRMEAIEVS